ncbi:transposase [Komagataeibacter sp. FXV3]|uniref:transposase n=1 Tax=Komagataeibacter sp. FXV3 TaxID=2608998 RepID=UPI0031FA27A4
MCDGQGRPVRLPLTAGQVSAFKGIDVLLADLLEGTEEFVGDRGYDSNRIRLLIAKRNITACVPQKKNRKSKPPYNWHLYKKRHLIENMFAKLKDWRHVATRYDRCVHTFISAIPLRTVTELFPRLVPAPIVSFRMRLLETAQIFNRELILHVDQKLLLIAD